MAAMPTLRRTRWLTRFVLVWLLLSLGVSIASPLVHPVALQTLCSVGGTRMVLLDDEGKAIERGHASLDCPLCIGMAAPPPSWRPPLADAAPPLRATPWALVAPLPARPLAPYQARAPPPLA